MSAERYKLINLYKNMESGMKKALDINPVGTTMRIAQEFKQSSSDTPVDAMKNFQHEMHGMLVLIEQMKRAQTVVFSTEQAMVFMGVAKSYTDSLDYRLPFPFTFLQFTSPLPVDVPMFDQIRTDNIAYIMLAQSEMTRDMYDELNKDWKSDPYLLIDIAPNLRPGILNNAIIIYKDMDLTRFGWLSDDHNELMVNDEGVAYDYWVELKRLCIACIGYINCENVYLEKQGEVPESVNRKREAKGKSRLEPYYVCRIKGVQHDGHATGTGAKHGIRYDVRGHFRRLETGKTIWVRPHQRGLQNELYVPKVYKVEKGSKPQWKP